MSPGSRFRFFMTANRLVNSSSPYLRQHASNPVNWYEWNDESLSLARTLKRPIFLSIGYSTCHWCHVMARESFSDPDIAKILNENFVNIKVDREERPDLDRQFMVSLEKRKLLAYSNDISPNPSIDSFTPKSLPVRAVGPSAYS